MKRGDKFRNQILFESFFQVHMWAKDEPKKQEIENETIHFGSVDKVYTTSHNLSLWEVHVQS